MYAVSLRGAVRGGGRGGGPPVHSLSSHSCCLARVGLCHVEDNYISYLSVSSKIKQNPEQVGFARNSWNFTSAWLLAV